MTEPPHSLQVGPEGAGQRLDRFLLDRFSGAGRAAVQALIADGGVRKNGRRARKGELLAAGDTLLLQTLPQSLAARPDPDAMARVTVVHEDAQLVVVDKPAGMPSHPLQPGELGTLASALLSRYPEMAAVGHSEREPGLLHRLDTDTGGLMLAARDGRTFDALAAALRRGEVDKHYLARCQGAPLSPGPLAGHLRARGPTVRLFDTPQPDTRPVSLRVLRSETTADADSCRVWVSAHVAARHQVRVQLAHVGRPLLGDTRYGGPSHPAGRHLLHAGFLALSHPVTGQRIALESAAPVAFWD